MRRCVIIGGAEIRNYEGIREYLQADDFVICCDSGLKHCVGLRVVPELVVGDFDSHAKPDFPAETIVLPREKDDTDSMFAIRMGVERGFTDFLLLGMIGGRLDHTLGNVYTLLWLANRGRTAMAVDDCSELSLVTPSAPGFAAPHFPYFSLLNITGKAEGITIRNAKFPLEDAEILPEHQLGISNEPLPGQTAEISLREGVLLLIRVFSA